MRSNNKNNNQKNNAPYQMLITREPYARIITLDQTIVDFLLSRNTLNRPVKKSTVTRYVRDIVNGDWRLTGQGISLSKTGVLLDGQHRLLAIKDANYPPLEIVLVSGLDDEAQKVCDQHTKRSARDVFGLHNDSAVSRAAPSILQVLSKYEDIRRTGIKTKSTLTISESEALYRIYQPYIEAMIDGLVLKSYFPAPILGAAISALERNPGEFGNIIWFMNNVQSGELQVKRTPQFRLRDYINKSRNKGGGQGPQRERFAMTSKHLYDYLAMPNPHEHMLD